MARLTSDLVLSLTDKVSGPARKVGHSLDSLNGAVRRSNRLTGADVMDMTARGPKMLAAASAAASLLAPAAAAAGATASVRRFAEAELAIERIGITAGASAEETRAAFGVIQKAARDYALSQDEVTAGLDTLVASGRDLDDAMAFLPSVTATAQASGAVVTDIASTADAIGRNFKIAGADMQDAFDIIVEGGKAGQFELRDMASYLPALAPGFTALGYEGEAGLKRMVAMLQTLRAGSGSAEQAASAAMNVFSKIESEDTVNRFKKMGVDLRKEMARARREGRDLLEVFVDLTRETINGDLSKIPQLFGDQEMQIGMRALINNGQVFTDVMRSLGQAAGSTGRDLARVLGTTQAQINKLSSSWDAFVQSLGAGIAPVAVPMMEEVTEEINEHLDYQRGVARESAAGGSEREAFAEYARLYDEAYGKGYFNGIAKQGEFLKDMAAFGRGDLRNPFERIEQLIQSNRRGNKEPFGPVLPDLGVTRRGGALPLPERAPTILPATTPNANMDYAAQRESYNEGRRQRERAAPRGPAPDFSSGGRGQAAALGNPDGFMSPEQRAYIEQRNRMAGIEPPPPPPAPAPMPSPALQSALDQASATTRNFWGSAGKPEIAAPLAEEGTRAQAMAESIGAAILQALSITASPTVQLGGMQPALAMAQQIAAVLDGIPGKARAAAEAASAASRQASLNYRQELDGLHADLSRAG